MNNNVRQKKKLSILSIISLALSIGAIYLYSAVFSNKDLVRAWILASIASVILPIVAKKVRINKKLSGSVFELIALVLGGFAFYCVIFAATNYNIIIGYLGWIIGGIIYAIVAKEDDEKTEDDVLPSCPQPAEENKSELVKQKSYKVPFFILLSVFVVFIGIFIFHMQSVGVPSQQKDVSYPKLDISKVYYIPGEDTYHSVKSCDTLVNKKTLYMSSLDFAVSQKLGPCRKCVDPNQIP